MGNILKHLREKYTQLNKKIYNLSHCASSNERKKKKKREESKRHNTKKTQYRIHEINHNFMTQREQSRLFWKLTS